MPQTWVLTVTGKRNKTREVPLNPDVVHLLALHAGEFLQEDKHCTDADSLPLIRTLHPSVPQWGRALEEVNGVPIEVVSELAGHASIDTTSIYSTQELARKIRGIRVMRRRVLVPSDRFDASN